MSKRDQQRKRREQKQKAAEQRQKTQRILGKVALFLVLPAFILLGAYALVSQAPTYAPVEVAPNDHIRGNPDTPVTITVYADFQCPACANENQVITRAWPQIRDKAHLIFRHYPITEAHPNSWTASLYAEAAARQGRFWEMHDILFANQPVWAGLLNVEDEFDSYALELNLDLEQLHGDIGSEEVIQKLRADQRGGNQAGVRSTPTLFINGRLTSPPSVSRLVDLVEDAVVPAAS
ncbi:MAG: thioredoxin domain-containing protein [Pseudohongiellaceae bacterium]